MFNQSGFNRTAFNAPAIIDLPVAAHLSGAGTLNASTIVEVTASAHLTGAGALQADFIREILDTATLSGEGTLQAGSLRERLAAVLLSGHGTWAANGMRYQVRTLRFTGDFSPGDRIEIDMKGRILLNGANAYSLKQGDFFSLTPGENTITYEDDAGSRSVRIRVTHRDRWL